jgi:hypothetical protein
MNYAELLNDVKSRIRQAQIKAGLSVNAEMLGLYWDIGRMVDQRQKAGGWGAGVIPRLAADIRNELPKVKGFSERNIKRMRIFYREYSNLIIGPQAVPQSTSQTQIGAQAVPHLADQTLRTKLYALVPRLPWAHNIILIEKVKDADMRLWYMEQAIYQRLGARYPRIVHKVGCLLQAREGCS